MMRYLVIFLFLVLFIGGITACENIKQTIGISTKPFQSGESFENSTKINYKITLGKIRPKEDDD